MTSVTIAFISFIIGAVGGYLAHKFFSPAAQSTKTLQEKVEQSEQALSQYQTEVAEHLEQSAQLLEQMNETCQTAMQQMEQSTQLLKKASVVESSTNMPFFSAETQQQLAETAAKRHPKRQEVKKAEISQPPLDYSEESSGLFVDQKQPVTNSDT